MIPRWDIGSHQKLDFKAVVGVGVEVEFKASSSEVSGSGILG